MQTLKRALAGPLLYLAVVLLLAGCAAPLADKARYAAAVLDQVRRAGTGISELSTLAGSPQLDDPAWREDVTAAVTTLRGVVTEAQGLTAPEALAGAHQTYLDAVGRLDGALTSVEGAVAASDPARLREAVPLLAEVQTLLTTAQGLIGG